MHFSTSTSGDPGAGGLWTKIRETHLKGSGSLWLFGFELQKKIMFHVYLQAGPHLEDTAANTTLSFLSVRWHFLQKKELDYGGNKQPVNAQGIELAKHCGLRSANSLTSLQNTSIS